MMKKLVEVQSMHEQREMFGNPEIIIAPGVWIEILTFNETTEQVDIKHRWEVEEVEKKVLGDIKKYKVVCRKLNIKEIEEKKEALAKEVLVKHNERLKASFVKCLVDGISVRTPSELKMMLNKLEGG